MPKTFVHATLGDDLIASLARGFGCTDDELATIDEIFVGWEARLGDLQAKVQFAIGATKGLPVDRQKRIMHAVFAINSRFLAARGES